MVLDWILYGELCLFCGDDAVWDVCASVFVSGGYDEYGILLLPVFEKLCYG